MFFEIDLMMVVLVSVKMGKGVFDVLLVVVENILYLIGDENKFLKMMLVDLWYDNFRGVVFLVCLFDGII